MEQLKGTEMKDRDAGEAKVRLNRLQTNPDRIVLDEETMTVAKRIAHQLDEAFSGIVKLKTKEIINFILQSRSHLFDKSELKAIREKHFDDVRAAQWALEQLQLAKGRGENLTLHDVLARIQTPPQVSDRSDGAPIKSRAKKLRAEVLIDTTEIPDRAHDSSQKSESLTE